MTDPKEFNSLDELFRKTFEDLPETPASSGWDNPSPQVWDEVRVRLKPPRSGWSTKAIMLVSGLAVVLLLGLYWTLIRQDQPSALPESRQTPSTAMQQPAPAESVAVAPEAVETPAVQRQQTGATQNLTPERRNNIQDEVAIQSSPSSVNPPAANTTERPAEEHGRVRPSGSVPLPGSNPASPNTTVRRQAEAWRKAPWAKPLAPLPSVLDTRIIRPVPQGLKDIYSPK